MNLSLVWLVAGIALVVAELLSGTFYLLVLGAAAAIAALAAFLGAPFLMQVLVAGAVAVAGVMGLRAWGRGRNVAAMPPLDLDQAVTLERWVSREDRTARVRYRDAFWDAVVEGDVRGEPGEVLYIMAVEGSTLHVGRRTPAAG